MKAAIFTPASGETYRSSIASATAAMVVAVLSGVARGDGASCAATAVASRVAARRIVLGMPPFVYNWRAAHNGFRRRACKFYVVNMMPKRRRRQHGLTAYDTLRDRIVRGRLAPGARLIETELASELGVSRTPVREAIVRLVQDGLAVAPRRSTRTQVVVTPLTAADLHELYTIMGALEGAVARVVGS